MLSGNLPSSLKCELIGLRGDGCSPFFIEVPPSCRFMSDSEAWMELADLYIEHNE